MEISLAQDQWWQLPCVIGQGITGRSFLNFLQYKKVKKVLLYADNLTPLDFEALQNDYSDMQIIRIDFSQHDLQQATIICLSPGFPKKRFEALNALAPIIGDVELFSQIAQMPLLAVTGSNGKTSVCDLVYQMGVASNKKVLMGGNMGIALLDAWVSQQKNHIIYDFAVIEISSFQLESCYQLRLHAAVVLNITPDHMDRYDSFEQYKNIKCTIYNHATYKIFPQALLELGEKMVGEKYISLGCSDNSSAYDFTLTPADEIFHHGDLLADVSKWHCCLPHQVANVMAALALASTLPLQLPALLMVAADYKNLAHRCDLIFKHAEVEWYNDSKATNVASAKAAIIGVAKQKKRIIWLAGGQAKGAEFSSLRPIMAQYVKHALLFGEDAQLIKEAIQPEVQTHMCTNMQQAIQLANELAQMGDAVLLSPACASFDMFKNFEERGNQFVDDVHQLN